MTDIKARLRDYPINVLCGNSLHKEAADHIAAQDKRIAELEAQIAAQAGHDPYCWFHVPTATVHRTTSAPADKCIPLYMAPPVPADAIDAERYRSLRNVQDDQLGADGIPCIAIPCNPHGSEAYASGSFVSHDDADNYVDAAIIVAAAMKAAK